MQYIATKLAVSSKGNLKACLILFGGMMFLISAFLNNITAEDGTLKIKLTSEEFLSGLRKGDKLIPIITAVVYLGEAPWDGPRCLHDMLDFKSDAVKSFVPD